MTSLFSPRRVFSSLTVLTLLLASACTTPPAKESASAPPLQTLDYSGSQQAVEVLDREIAAAGQNRAKLEAISTRLISLLRDSTTTPAARQVICQRLSLFPESTFMTGENRAVFATLLGDQNQVNLARLTLDRIHGEGIDALYLDALKTSTSHTRLALVQSIGNRRVAVAVPALATLLKDPDGAITAATAKALGQIGTRDALTALLAAPNPESAGVIEARLSAAHQLGSMDAAKEFQAIAASSNAPANLRAAAVHGLLLVEPASAPARIVGILGGDDPVLKPVVIEAIASHPAKDLVSALADKLTSFDAQTQAAVIAALGRKGDSSAVPALIAATESPDSAVRSAAITALGKLRGSPEVTLLLGRIAAADNADEAKLARLSLSRLTGPGVAETVVTGATRGEQPLRLVFLEQLASRNMVSSIPLLLATREDPNAAVRSAALGSLAEIAPPSEQRAILDWSIAAIDPAEQARALRALASVTLRNPDISKRAQLITSAIEKAPPAVALRLLPVLPRIGGAASAESAAKLALSDDAAVSSAAISTLARWNDRAGLLPLTNVAEKATSDSARLAAMEGVVRYLERSRDLPSAELTAIVARLVPLCRDTETRIRLVYVLGRSSGDDALALATKYQSDPALNAVATDTVAIIQANRAGQPAVRASANETRAANIVDGKLSTRWNVPARANQWIEVDFKLTRPFRQIVLDNNGETWGYPESFAVFVTDDPKNPGESRVSGSGRPTKTIIDLPTGTRGRYLIIRHTTESDDNSWAISELVVD